MPYAAPYHWPAMVQFLAARATAGVEDVSEASYRRTISVRGHVGSIEVAPMAGADALIVDIAIGDPGLVPGIVERVARMFDVDAAPAAIARVLSRDAKLRRAVRQLPGIRVPGAWDPFEVCVRAILGQQVSVRGATTVAGRLALRWGDSVEDPSGRRLFPSPAALADAPLEECGIIRTRAAAIRAVARAVRDRALSFEADDTARALLEIRGIGDWTAQYVAMRTSPGKDAFPAGDLVLRRKAGAPTPRALLTRAEKWRPYRSYAAMLLWMAN